MLARHAEDLFWIGRYLERAEDTARLLDVTHHSVLEAGTGRSADDMWAELLEVLYLDDETPGLSSEQVERLLVADRSHPGSIASTIGRARENARASREWLSSEFWEGINALHLELSAADLDRLLVTEPYILFRRVKTGCQALWGVADSSLPRSEGYRFLSLGATVERAVITARVVSVWHRRLGGFSGPAAFPEWVKLLRSLGAYEAYLRDFRASMQSERVLEFLLQSPDFPRSLLFCLSVIEGHLDHLSEGQYGRTSRRAAGRMRAELEFAEPKSLPPPALAAFLEHTETEVLGIGDLVEADYFRPRADALIHAYEAF